jgi:hypothetical protein
MKGSAISDSLDISPRRAKEIADIAYRAFHTGEPWTIDEFFAAVDKIGPRSYSETLFTGYLLGRRLGQIDEHKRLKSKTATT